ncbi:hypothetical protein F2Q70_00004682 [Brassica cretica]|uniref:Uncharacterized protein n=2 Tax=Brassica cretica TaxID=69181 RepID=A0A3N6PLC8_BRACR|nr:hypothetical protein F2Q68_00021522 [Brassica cretica]KAF2571006.1 hypothetical protein F2Q70_00004682 [Brassica cretica]KAF3564556.1 hypothetical protein DY000_02016786 [Brassica cretica]
MHMKPISKKKTKGEESKEVQMTHIEEAFKEDQEEESPMENFVAKDLGIIVDDPRTLFFEEIKM